jgi:iron complex transport system ATP-binding protein
MTNESPLLLAIDGATVRRAGRHILDNISLQIPQGQHTAIVGPNGSGKTTLIKLITMQHYALARDDGQPTVTILGKHRWDVFEMRAMMGIVSSDLHHDFVATGRIPGIEVVLSGFFSSHGLASNHDVTDAMRVAAREALAQMQASHLADKHMEEMSTGEARRVVLARALVRNPPSLLLDEPTTGLDMVARRRFLETLRGIARQDRTIILVTHHVEEIIPEIGVVILMRDGRITVSGAKTEILTSNNLSDAYGASVTVREAGGYYAADIGEVSEPTAGQGTSVIRL